MSTTTAVRGVGALCGLLSVGLLCEVYVTTGSLMVIAVIALAAASLLVHCAPDAATGRSRRLLLPLIASVAVSTAAALSVVWAAATPAGPVPCVGPGTVIWVELALALAAQTAATGVVVGAANTARGRASWWVYLRHTPRIRASLTVVLQSAAFVATTAVLGGAVACDAAHSKVTDAVAAGTVAAAVTAVNLLLAVRLLNLLTVAPASPADLTGVELALLAADVRSVNHLAVVQVAHDEVMVTARIGIAADADVAATLARARAHIRDFVPEARHIYLQPEPRR
ncbi:hypothetical protein KZZ52_36425 [Dactylosporangium sp. AC04546]|uniref:hypothetical protein n=1 Tax=Dactylosporangium sp. AC04546 TaxID=2862460 RepID=UPI001EDCE9D7|nr:hypothetical protein [Dactylosporangium sp. AC04546]WVK79452.1 hypothetical protein KZZ52_36425 [Dactylosporangium sp. AC04546]